MRHTVFWMACAMACLAGCERPAPAPVETASSEVAVPDEYTVVQRAKEALLAKGFEAQVRRDQDQLAIYDDDRAVAIFTDNDTFVWFFAGRFTKGDEPFYLVRMIRTETDSIHETLVVDRTGLPVAVLLDDVQLTEGPKLASGSGGSVDGSRTRIDDWSAKSPVFYAFDTPCDPVKWIDATHVSATCSTEEEGSSGDAIITRIASDTWELTETPGPTPPKTRKTYHERVKAQPYEPVDAETIQYLTKIGFKRLVVMPDAG